MIASPDGKRRLDGAKSGTSPKRMTVLPDATAPEGDNIKHFLGDESSGDGVAFLLRDTDSFRGVTESTSPISVGAVMVAIGRAGNRWIREIRDTGRYSRSWQDNVLADFG